MLLDKNLFEGLDNTGHLSAGGETPMLHSHRDAFEKIMQHKARGEKARSLIHETLLNTREQCARMFNVDASDIVFLSSTSEGINIVAYGLDWKPGDNVVIADVEFGSGVYPWTLLQQQGVEIKIVRHKEWQIYIDDIAAQIDSNTRLVFMSHVSMFTGQRIPLQELADAVHQRGAALVLDATHAAGEKNRAGNICIMSDRVDEISEQLRQRGVLVRGTYGSDSRLRISAHVYNDESDIDACLDAPGSLD